MDESGPESTLYPVLNLQQRGITVGPGYLAAYRRTPEGIAEREAIEAAVAANPDLDHLSPWQVILEMNATLRLMLGETADVDEWFAENKIDPNDPAAWDGRFWERDGKQWVRLEVPREVPTVEEIQTQKEQINERWRALGRAIKTGDFSEIVVQENELIEAERAARHLHIVEDDQE